MSAQNIDLQQIVEELTAPGLTENVIAMRWVEFICESLPKLDRQSIIELQEQIDNADDPAVFSFAHRHLLKDIEHNCFPTFEIPTNGPHTFRVGYALAQTCVAYSSDLTQQVFENITSENAARELFGYCAMTGSAYLASLLNYLNSQGIIDIQNWNSKVRWPDQLALTPGKIGNVPSRLKVKDSKYPISEAAQARFPFLQEAIDHYSDDPAFPTVWPLISKLASQVARDGKLSRHIALLGPPGVDKTESAKLLHHLLESMSACGSSFKIFSPGKDASQFVDHMARQMRNVLQGMRASGGLLLIDEAGKFNESSSANDPASFRKRTLDVVFEQVDQLLEQGIVVVFAGYRHEFEKVLKQDAGFERRVLMLDIDPPATHQLAYGVLDSLVKEGVNVPPNFLPNTQWLFDQMVEDDSMNFGYWATAKNFERALLDSLDRDFLALGSDDSKDLSELDFQNAAKDIGYMSMKIRDLDFKGPITPDQTPGSDLDAELRSFMDPPSPPAPEL